MKLFVSIPQNSRVMNRFFRPETFAYLEERFEVVYSPLTRWLKAEEIAEYAADADAIMIGWGHPMMRAKDLENTSIKLIVHTGSSVADYVTDDVYEAGIRVISGSELYAESVAEGAFAYMLAGLRRLPEYMGQVRNGGWTLPGEDMSQGILDQYVGIIGMGVIAKSLIKMLKPFRVKLKLYSGYPIDEAYLKENDAVQASLEEIFSTCRVISVHSALNDRTKGMIGKEHFDLLQDGAIFVNTARGAIIREDEMIEALKENRFRAVLDVFCQEPLAQDSPLRCLENVYCMPHMGGPTADRCPNITLRLADDMERFANGDALHYEITGDYAKRMTKQR